MVLLTGGQGNNTLFGKRARPPLVRVDARREDPIIEEEPTEVETEAEPEEHGYRIEQLNSRQCRFAITSFRAQSHRFCGDPVIPGSWCCEKHHAVAFTPERARLRAR